MGYQLDSVTFEEKVQALLEIIDSTLGRKKIKLKEMQYLTCSLAFCAKAMPSAREFIRRMYASMSGINKPFHHIRLSNGKKDLMTWHQFLSGCNGISYMQDKAWVSFADIMCRWLCFVLWSLLCRKSFEAKRIQYACNNMAVVHISNSKTAMASCQSHR